MQIRLESLQEFAVQPPERLARLGIMMDLLRAFLKPLKNHPNTVQRISKGDLNWVPIRPRRLEKFQSVLLRYISSYGIIFLYFYNFRHIIMFRLIATHQYSQKLKRSQSNLTILKFWYRIRYSRNDNFNAFHRSYKMKKNCTKTLVAFYFSQLYTF